MSCNCTKNKMTKTAAKQSKDSPKTTAVEESKESVVVEEAFDIDLPQCYLCAKKHIGQAMIYWEEFHTGYPERTRRLVESLRVAEHAVRNAFVAWQKALAHLAMAGAELIGRHGDLQDYLLPEHIRVANLIRDERVKLQDNPTYSPDFEKLLVEIQLLQYAE